MSIDTAATRRWIAHNLHHVKRLNDVAPHFGVSSEALRKVFKRREGVVFSKFLREQRVLKARQLLQDTDLSCGEICLAVGFSRVEVGERAFKRLTGKTMNRHRIFYKGSAVPIGPKLHSF